MTDDRDELVGLIRDAPCIVEMEKGWHLHCTNLHDKKHPGCVAAALRSHADVVMRGLGFEPVAMSDTGCGWVVSDVVEAAGAWSTAPHGGWVTPAD